jgi:hypothetical protein
MRALLKSATNLEVVLVALPLAFCLQFIPFQHYMSLSRFQHYSFTLFLGGAGFLLQSILSWRRIGLCGRVALVGTATYWLSLASVLLFNPWMDIEGSMSSELQLVFEHQMACLFSFFMLPVVASWFAWAMESRNPGHARGQTESTSAETAERSS